MRFFELHFNPQKGKAADIIFDSFCYEPQNPSEKRLGHLFLAGELRNVLPSTLELLDSLADHLKKNYYSSPLKSSTEAAIKTSLKKTNEFLEELAKQGQVSWLGNLNLGICSISPQQKNNFSVNFAKVGNLKILLLRAGQVIDIGKNLEFSEIEPYPLKIFSNIVSGKLIQEDMVAILTKEVFDFFSEKGILKEIASLSHSQLTLKEILKNKEKDLKGLSGVFLLCLLSKESSPDKKEAKTSLTFQKDKEVFSLQKVFLPFINQFKKLSSKLFANQELKVKRIRKFLRNCREVFESLRSKKNLILLLLLLFLLILGFLLF